MKNTVVTFREAKGREKLSMLTAYDYTVASLIDSCGINAILVGDSLGMVSLGYPDTLPVTMADMVSHCAAVSRGVKNALLVCDMPFMSSQCGVERTLLNAGKLVKKGRAQAVKLEGGAEFAPEVRALARASIPVMAHLGLTPQSVNAIGGYKVRAKERDAAQKLLDDAREMEEAGAFCVLLECVPAPLAARVTRELAVPTIGIGAGPDCDGQVLVWQDMLGLNPAAPKFARRFAEIGETMKNAFTAYDRAVKTGAFPDAETSYCVQSEVADNLK